MPTQKERLQTLEFDLSRFKTETIKAYSETAIELVMVKGLTEDAVKRLTSLKSQIEQQAQQVHTHLEAIDAHLNYLQVKADKTEQRLDAVEQRLNSVEQRLGSIERLLTQILERLH
jgi:peptidoglycan hydrolase CwlO-like protein